MVHTSELMVDVHENNEVIGQVNATRNLDYWDPIKRAYNHGLVDVHKGLAFLEDRDSFVVISSWTWEDALAFLVSDEEALQEILKSGNDTLMDKPKFARLKALAESTIWIEPEILPSEKITKEGE